MSDSTTFWISQLKKGNTDAAQQLWERYYVRLLELTRKRLSRRCSRAASDENDIVQSAFASFYHAVECGRFPQLESSADLWRILFTITRRRVNRRIRYANAAKRRLPGRPPEKAVNWDTIIGDEPTPDFCVAAVDSFNELLNKLGDPMMRSIAVMRMEGYTVAEIARGLKTSCSTIERKLRLIRRQWSTFIDNTSIDDSD